MRKVSIHFPHWKLFLFLLLALIFISVMSFILHQYCPFYLTRFFIGSSSFVIIALLVIIFYPSKNRSSQKKQQSIYKLQSESVEETTASHYTLLSLSDDIRHKMRTLYGTFWHKKVSILLLLGSSTAVDKLASNLPQEQWQENDGTLLIYGGDIRAEVDVEQVEMLKRLRRRHPLDGVIWVTETQISSALLDEKMAFINLNLATTDMAGRYLHNLFRTLGWRAPIWVWGVSDNSVICADNTPSVMCLTAPASAPEALSPALLTLLSTLNVQGTLALLQQPKHTYLLTLARGLKSGGSEQLAEVLAPLFSGFRALPVAGLVFSPPVVTLGGQHISHRWQPDSRWHSWLGMQPELAPALQPAALAINGKPVLYYLAATAMTLWGIGMVVSYLANRQLITDSQQNIQAVMNPQHAGPARLKAHYQFQQTLGLLDNREGTTTPLWLRFGLNNNHALLAQLWPVYQQALLPLLRDNIHQALTCSLHAFAQLPPESKARAEASPQAYQALKAYLMTTTPEHMDPPFFTDTVLASLPKCNTVENGEWQTLGRELLMFYARQLPLHPEWAISPDQTLINSSRTLIIRQIGQRSGESAIYQKILQQAKYHHADLTLNEMSAETDINFLFSTREFVPGIFTRKAWEESVEPAIKRVAEDRRDEIDWVLSDNQHSLDQDIAPEQLKQRLTDRYFSDFAGSWLNFFNSLQWQKTDSLSDTIDQLTLISDVRHSPMIALMNTLSYQGKTGRQQEKQADSLVHSAKEVINREQMPVISQKAEFTGPLEAVFGPVLNFTAPMTSTRNDNLSLQAYLTRVTQVRLKLQQVVNAPNPQAMSQALAQRVFEGKAVSLSETRDYGSLIAASLGQEWYRFGETLLVEPMAQAWQQLLTPAVQGINTEWKNAIINEWNSAFAGRYPLKDTQSEISLPLMAQYLKPDNGRIQRFLETRLQGVLRKQGNQWVPNSAYSQGLDFNPAFLSALNTLSALGDIAFTNGEARMFFEIRPETNKNIMQTTLIIDKQKLVYDNQHSEWQRFAWPADTIASGASLSWMTTTSGTRSYADYAGVWGIIRLLERATVTPYAGSSNSYILSWSTFGGNTLSYVLRTEVSNGPLALLKLRNFVLPEKIFLDPQ